MNVSVIYKVGKRGRWRNTNVVASKSWSYKELKWAINKKRRKQVYIKEAEELT